MTIQSLTRCSFPILATLFGCGLFEPGDVPASVTWLEARFPGTELQLRVVGSTGCGRLTHLGVQARPGTVIVYARASREESECLTPLAYDTTLSIPTPNSWSGIRVSASQTGTPADAVEVFSTSLAFGLRIDALVGGTALVEGVAEGCPRIRVHPGEPTQIVYPIEFSREIEIRDGDRLLLAGVLPQAVSSLCYGGPVIWVKRFTLSLARHAAA